MQGDHRRRRRTVGDARGFSLVELLVTIIVAGFFFAAMVPVFLMAAEQSSTDRGRILATNTAQGVIEQLRDLPYTDLLAVAGVDPSDAAVQLGLDPGWKGERSELRITVATYPDGAAAGSEDYLVATVTAAWVGEGGTPHSTTMKTAIYRQGLGTETLVLLVYPLFNGYIRDTPVTVSAQLDASEMAQTLQIDFTVYANNGTQIETWSVLTSEATHTDGDPTWYYNHPWQATTADGQALADGRYSFVAKTIPVPPPDPSDPVPPSQWASKEYVLDRAVPGKPTITSTTAGRHAPSPGATPQPFVHLAWKLEPNVSDLDHFEVGRTGTGADGTPLPEKVITLPRWALEYVDRDVVAGATYTYQVAAQDIQEQRGEWSDGSSLALAATTLDHVPSPPQTGSISYAIEGRSVTCAWWSPSPNSGIDAYRVYRQGADGVRLLIQTVPAPVDAADPSLVSYTDITVEYGATYTYFVTSVSLQVDDLQWESASTSGPPVKVPEPPKVGMIVDVQIQDGLAVPKYARVMIHSLDTGDIIPANPWDYPTIDPGNANKSTWVTGDILYPGAYEVIAIFYAQDNSVLGTYSSDRIDVTSSATPVHVPYLGPN